jgi:predicted MPP superfamily phosphohydrolase
MRFLIILFTLLFYSFFKATQLWPSDPYLAVVLVLPFFLLMIGPLLFSRLNHKIQSTFIFRILVWLSSFLMGVFGTYILLSIPMDIVSGIVMLVYKIFTGGHRNFLSHSFYLSILGISFGFAILGLLQVLRGVKVKEVNCTIETPKELNNLKIAQISDLHIGPTIRKKYVEQVVRKTNALNPDFIFITGDLIDATPSTITDFLAPLGNLKSRLGIFYVPGNHEYYWGVEDLIQRIKILGFIPLINENRVVTIGNKKILIAGVTDPAASQILKIHHPDLIKASKTNEKPDLKILLAHRPDECLEAEPLGYNLQFSGHTHAGQFFPFSLLIPFFHKYYKGLNRHGRMWVYVNPGTGYWGPANRFANNSEITSFIIKSS